LREQLFVCTSVDANTAVCMHRHAVNTHYMCMTHHWDSTAQQHQLMTSVPALMLSKG